MGFDGEARVWNRGRESDEKEKNRNRGGETTDECRTVGANCVRETGVEVLRRGANGRERVRNRGGVQLSDQAAMRQ